MEQAKAKLRAFLGRHIGGRVIGDEEQIFASGFVNSMFAMQIILFLEKNFQIAIADEDLELKNFQTINAMVALIERKTGQPQTIRTA
jgi:acyl carrier protein